MIGRSLSHYKVLEKIGEGGMGEVYVAEDTKLGRKVALKVLPPEMAANAERRARFEREKAAGNLEEAKKHYQKAIEVSVLESKPQCWTALGRALLKDGQMEEAKSLLDEVVGWATEQVSSGNERHAVHYAIASAHAIRGNRQQAYQRLKGAIDTGYRNYQELQADPSWEAFREEEQFKRIVADLKAMNDEMLRRIEAMEKEWS